MNKQPDNDLVNRRNNALMKMRHAFSDELNETVTLVHILKKHVECQLNNWNI